MLSPASYDHTRPHLGGFGGRGNSFFRFYGPGDTPHSTSRTVGNFTLYDFVTPFTGNFTFHLWGGGGGGRNGQPYTGNQNGGPAISGAGGAYLRKTMRMFKGQVLKIQVGTGGLGAVNWDGTTDGRFFFADGGQGGDSKLGNSIIAAGGQGGDRLRFGYGMMPIGGVAIGGDFNVNGGPGDFTNIDNDGRAGGRSYVSSEFVFTDYQLGMGGNAIRKSSLAIGGKHGNLGACIVVGI